MASKEELAGRANHYFEAKDYAEAVETLEQLPDPDPKVMHNLAVARYFLDRGADSFFDAIVAAKKTLAIQENADGGDDFEDDETDSAVMCYNLAVIHYQRREFDSALQLLDRLFKVIEAIEEGVARKICLLLLDLHMVQYQPVKAGYILQYLERTLAGPQTKEGGKDEDKKPKEAEQHAGSANPELELLKFQLHQYRARMYIITRSMKACKREIKSALNFSNQSATALFLKSNFEYARRNYRKAIKLLNSCPKSEPHVSGQSLAGMYYNDLGCVHFQMRKYALANVYFGKAISANEQEAGRAALAADAKHAPLKTLVADRIHELMYNQGLNFLFMKRPEMAYMCFKAGMLLFSANPRIWLRIAECCIQVHARKEEAANDLDASAYFRKCGSAQNRKIIVVTTPKLGLAAAPKGLSLESAISYLTTALSLLDAAVAKQKVPAAAAPPLATSPTTGATPLAPANAVSFALPGTRTSPIQEGDVTAIRYHIMANLAYCHLGNANLSVALALANEMIGVAGCPGPLRFLAHLYAAECLIHMRRMSQAIQHLTPDNIGDLSSGSSSRAAPGGDSGDGDAAEASTPAPEQAFTAESAKTTMLMNISAAYAIRGSFEACLKCLAQVTASGPTAAVGRKVVLMTIYALLCEGRTADALALLEKNKMPK